MRQWACIVALLLGLAGNGYTSTARPRLPVPIERRLDLEPLGAGERGARRTGLTLDWWRA